MTRFRSSAWAAPVAVAMQVDPLTAQSAVSIGLMVTIIGAVAWLSRALTRGEEQMKAINEKLAALVSLPERMALIERDVGEVRDHIRTLEGDVNNLWSAVRREDGDLLDNTRRERGPRPRKT